MMIFNERIRGIRTPLRLSILTVCVILILLGACIPETSSQPAVEDTSTPTITASPTPTVEWFPATATPTRWPTAASIPTPEQVQNQGEIIFTDDFTDSSLWTLGTTTSGNISLGVNELTIAIAEPGAYQSSIREEPKLGDFYVEITSYPTLCQAEDQFGLILRMASPGDFYRFALSCDGRVRLDRIIGGIATSPQPWMQNNSVPPGALIPSRLGVWLRGKEMRFYINDQHQFTVTDPTLQVGNLGVFARSLGENAVTVNFSNLVVREISQ